MMEVYLEISNMARLVQSISAKFAELDADGSGELEGEELVTMADFFVKLVMPHTNDTTVQSHSELVRIKNQIMDKCDKNHSGSLSLAEMALVHEELLVRFRVQLEIDKTVRNN
jgi:Ca2+-binding EF-hand superfamily protein